MTSPLTGSNVPTDDINEKVDNSKTVSTPVESDDITTRFENYRQYLKKQSPVGINLGIPTAALGNVDKELIDDKDLKFNMGVGDIASGVNLIQKDLSEKQGVLGELANAIPQTAVKTFSGALSALGVGWEAIKSISPDHEFGFKDNGLMQAAADIDKGIQEMFPLYRDPTDDSLFTSEDIVEGITNLPGIATGAGLTSTGIRMLNRGIFYSASKALKAGLKNEVKQTAFQAFKSAIRSSPTSKVAYGTEWLTNTVYQGASEGYMEAVQLYTDTVDKLNEEATRDLIAGKIDKDQYLRKLQENEDRANNGAMVTFALGSALSTAMNLHWTKPGSGLFSGKLLGTAEDTYDANKKSWYKDLGIETGLESTEELLMAGITGGSEGLTSASMLDAPFSEQLGTFVKHGLQNMASEEGAFSAFMGGMGGAVQKIVMDGFNKLAFKESTGKYNQQLQNEINSIFKNNKEFITITGIIANNEVNKDIPKTSLGSVNNLVANAVGNHTESYLLNAINENKQALQQQANNMQDPEAASQAKQQLDSIQMVEDQLNKAVKLRDGNYSVSNKIRETDPSMMPSYIHDLLDADSRKTDIKQLEDKLKIYTQEINGKEQEGKKGKKDKLQKSKYNFLGKVADPAPLDEFAEGLIYSGGMGIADPKESIRIRTEMREDKQNMINDDIYINARNKALGEETEFTLFSKFSKYPLDPSQDYSEAKERYKELLDNAERQVEENQLSVPIGDQDKINLSDLVKIEKQKEDLENSVVTQTQKINEVYTAKNLADIAEKKKETEEKEASSEALTALVEDAKSTTEVPTETTEGPKSKVTIAEGTGIDLFTETPVEEIADSTIELDTSPEEPFKSTTEAALIEKEYKEDKTKVEEAAKEVALVSNITGVLERKEGEDVFTKEGTFQDILENQEDLFSRRLNSNTIPKERVLTYKAYDGNEPLQISEGKQTDITPAHRSRFVDSIAIYTEDGKLLGFLPKDAELYKQISNNSQFKDKGSVTFKSLVYTGTTKPKFKKSGTPIKDFTDAAKTAFRRLFSAEAKPFVIKEGKHGVYLDAIGDKSHVIGKIDYSTMLDELSAFLGATVLFTKSGAIALSTRILDSETVKSLYVNYGSKFEGDITDKVTAFLTAFTNIPAASTKAERKITTSFNESSQTLAVDIFDSKSGKSITARVKSNGEFTEELLQAIVTELKKEDKLGDKLRTGLNYETLRKLKIDTLEAVMAVFNSNLDFVDTSDGTNSIYYRVGDEMYVKINNETLLNPPADEEVILSTDSEFDEDVAFASAFSPISERVVIDVEYEEGKDDNIVKDINKKEFHDSIIKHIAFFAHKLGYDGSKIASLLAVDSPEVFLKKLNVQMTNPDQLELLSFWLQRQQERPDSFVKFVQAEASKMTAFYTSVAKSEDVDDESSDVTEEIAGDDDGDNTVNPDDADYDNTTDEAKKTQALKQEWHKMEMEIQQILSAVPMVDKTKTFIRSVFGTVKLLPPIKLIENVISAVNLSERSINSFTEFSDFIQTFKNSDNPYLNSFYYLWNALDTKSVSDPKIQMLQTKIYNHMKQSAISLTIVENNMTSGSLFTRTYGVTAKGVDFFSRFVQGVIGVMKQLGKRKSAIEKVKAAYDANIKVLNGLDLFEDSVSLDKGTWLVDGKEVPFKKAFKSSIINFFKDVYGIDLDRKGLDVYLTSHNGKFQDVTGTLKKALNALSMDNLKALQNNDKLNYSEKSIYLDTGAKAADFAASISLLAGKTVSTPLARIAGRSYYLFRNPGLINELITDETAWKQKTIAETLGLPETSTEDINKVRKFKIQKLWGAIRRTKRRSKNSETSTYTPREEFISALTLLFGLYNNSENPPLFTTPVISDTGDILVFGGHMYLKPDRTDTFNTLYAILTEYAHREYVTMLEMQNNKDYQLEGYSGTVSILFPFLNDLITSPEFSLADSGMSLRDTQKAKIEKELRKHFASKSEDSSVPSRFESWYEFLKSNNLVHKSETNANQFGFTPLISNINGFKSSVKYLSGLDSIVGKLFKSTYKTEAEFKKALQDSQFMEYYELLYLTNHMHYYEKIGMPHTMAKKNKKTKKTDAQATLDNMIKRAKAWVSSHSSARWLSKEFKVVVLKDETLKFVKTTDDNGSVVMTRVTEEGAPFTVEVNTTDAQEYSTPLEFLESLVAYGHTTEQDAFGMSYDKLLQVLEDLRIESQLIGSSGELFDNNGFINEESIEKFKDKFGSNFENFTKSKFYKLHSRNASGADTLIVPEKNVYCGPDRDFKLSTDKGLPGNRMVYVKSSTMPLIPANLFATDKKGNVVPTNKHSLLAFMLKHNINRAAQESAVKVGTRVGQIISMDELEKLDSKEVSKRTFTLDRKYYGRQQITQAKPKSKITMGTQLMYLLFEGDVNNAENEGINQIREQFIQALNNLLGVKQLKFLQDFGLELDKNKVLKISNIERFNFKLSESLDNYNDKLTTDLRSNFRAVKLGEELEFSIPIDLVANSEKLQESLASIINKNLVRIKLPGTSCIQVSSNGFKMIESDGLAAPSYNADKKRIEPGEAIITWPFGKEAWDMYQNPEDSSFRDFVNEKSTGIGFRIPTSGLPSTTYVKITWLHPDEGPIAVLSPVTVDMLGADFDVDKLNLYVRPLVDLWNVKQKTIADPSVINRIEAENNLFSIQESTFSGNTVDEKKIDIPVSRFNTMMNPIGTPTISGKIDNMKAQGIDSYYDATNPFGLLNIMNRRKVASESKILTGVFSVWVVALNKLQYYAKQTGGKLGTFIKLSSKLPVVDGTPSDGSFPFIGANSLKSASAYISELQNYGLDLAKDPNSDIPNINIYTSGVAGLLIALGYDMEFIINFIANPVVKEFVRRKALKSDTMSTAGSSAYSTADFIAELNKELTLTLKPLDNQTAIQLNSGVLASTVTVKNYVDVVQNKDMDIEHLLKAFDVYEEAARKLIVEIKYTRQNSVGVPKNLYELIIWNKNYLKSTFASLAADGKLFDTFTSYQWAFDLLEKMYFGRSFYKEQFFKDLVDRLDASGINPIENMSSIRTFVLRNIVKTKPMEHLLGPGDLTENPAIAKFTELLAIAKEKHPDNRFVQSITVGFDTEDYLYGGINKSLPKIEFILKDGDEDYQKSDIADALMQDFALLLNDDRELIDGIAMRDFMQAYIRYNYQVFTTSFRKGSILGLIPSSYITMNNTIRDPYASALDTIKGIGTEALLKDFAEQNKDLVMKVDVKNNEMDKINKVSVGGIAKDDKNNLYFVTGETADKFTLTPLSSASKVDDWDNSTFTEKLIGDADKSVAKVVKDLIATMPANIKIKVSQATTGNKFGSYNKSTNTLTIFEGKIKERFGFDGKETRDSLFLFTAIEELLHSKFTDTIETDIKQFIATDFPLQVTGILKAYGLVDLDSDLTASQKEELLILMTRSFIGDPLLQGLLKDGSDLSGLINKHFGITLKVQETTASLTAKEFFFSSRMMDRYNKRVATHIITTYDEKIGELTTVNVHYAYEFGSDELTELYNIFNLSSLDKDLPPKRFIIMRRPKMQFIDGEWTVVEKGRIQWDNRGKNENVTVDKSVSRLSPPITITKKDIVNTPSATDLNISSTDRGGISTEDIICSPS